MTQYLKCDQCGDLATVDERPGWLVCTDLDSDDDTLAYWHFCSWICASEYATARALVDS
jgi:hypothetical protein